MEIELLLSAFVTLFVIIDPIGLTPLFVVLTAGKSAKQRRRIAIRAILTAAGLLAFFGFAGEFMLAKIGIGIPAFRISGGILLLLTAIEMLFEKRTPRREKTAEDNEGTDPAGDAVNRWTRRDDLDDSAECTIFRRLRQSDDGHRRDARRFDIDAHDIHDRHRIGTCSGSYGYQLDHAPNGDVPRGTFSAIRVGWPAGLRIIRPLI